MASPRPGGSILTEGSVLKNLFWGVLATRAGTRDKEAATFRYGWHTFPGQGSHCPSDPRLDRKISASETPHTGRAGYLRQYDRLQSLSGDRYGLRRIFRLHRPASPRWRPDGSAASGTSPTSGAFRGRQVHYRCSFARIRQLWGAWRACDNPCHGEGAERQWASPDAQRKHRSWAQIFSLYACG